MQMRLLFSVVLTADNILDGGWGGGGGGGGGIDVTVSFQFTEGVFQNLPMIG